MPCTYVGAGWTTCLSASTMWVLALELRLSELVANTVLFICSSAFIIICDVGHTQLGLVTKNLPISS